MPNTTNLLLPYPASGDQPSAATLAALAQAVDAYAGPWTSWTPTLVQSAAVAKNVLYAKYRVVNKMLKFAFALDPTANGTGGSTIVIGLPPVAPKFTTVDMSRGIIDFVSQSTQGVLISPAGNTTTVLVRVFGGNYTTAISSTDFLRGWGQYEVA